MADDLELGEGPVKGNFRKFAFLKLLLLSKKNLYSVNEVSDI
tara:strand:- start:722 stop:847 length:126 start_codon:yes stop_codon:yes gene_type:complete